MHWRRGERLCAVIAVLGIMVGAASAATLEQIAQNKTVRIAYRDDAPPFSYKGKGGQPAGYVIDLCGAVVK